MSKEFHTHPIEKYNNNCNRNCNRNQETIVCISFNRIQNLTQSSHNSKNSTKWPVSGIHLLTTIEYIDTTNTIKVDNNNI